MATKKRLGHRTIVKLNGVAVGALKKITPAGKSREKVDVTDIDSDIMEFLDSDPPDMGEGKVELYWEPSEEGNEAWDEVFDAEESDDREATIALVYPFVPTVTDTFTARILKLTPNDITSKEGMARVIEYVQTSKTTRVKAGGGGG